MDLFWKRPMRLGFLKRRRRRRLSGLVCLLLLVSFLFLLNSKLSELQIYGNNGNASSVSVTERSQEQNVHLGGLGEKMITLLPDDLAFTIFIPSEEAFERILKLHAEDSLVEHKVNDTFAILSRLMGFSAVPEHLPSGEMPLHKETTFDSVSGYKLYMWKISDGTVVVNSIKSKQTDIKRGQIVVHIMHGVIMDPEFGLSFHSDDEDL